MVAMRSFAMAVNRLADLRYDRVNPRTRMRELVTGEVSWRQRPPSVRITGADAVIETLKRMQLERFVRTKEEPNKDAMLNEPEAVRGIAGISIVSGVEDFAIAPFAVDVEVAA